MRQEITAVIKATLHALKGEGKLTLETIPDFGIDLPRNPDHGDYAVNIAMMLAKSERKKPRDIAVMIQESLKDDEGLIESCDVAGPGFLNLRLNNAALHRVIQQVIDEGDAYGRARKKTGKRVNVEFVSANPTGPLHLGHARGAFMGDAVSRLLDAAGHEVTREFYVNDAGNQIRVLGNSIFTRYRELHGDDVQLKEGEYPAQYIVDIAKTLKAEDGDKWMGSSDYNARCAEIGIRENLADIKATLKTLAIEMDVWSSEAVLHDNNAVMDVVEVFRKGGHLYEATAARNRTEDTRKEKSNAAQHKEAQQGGTFLVTGEHGDEEDRIVLRRDGSPVYLTADLAYHKTKFDRGYDRMIDVWGADHVGHVPRIRAGMKLTGHDEKKLEFILVQIVRLIRDGKEVKLSKRAGEVYRLDDFVKDIGSDAVRYIFLSRTANAQFDFDLSVLEKKDKSNPVHRLQYGHARCVTLLKRAEEKGQPYDAKVALMPETLAALTFAEERDMLKELARFEDMIRGAAEALEPHRVIYYAQELINTFGSYYTKYKAPEDRVISDDKVKTQARLALVSALGQTIKNALVLLGISAPDYMSFDEDSDDTEES